jgi:hypothetical protein
MSKKASLKFSAWRKARKKPNLKGALKFKKIRKGVKF